MTNSIQSTSNVDGKILPTDQATVPVLDRGFLYGDSVYEVFRTYSGVPLFFDEHWDRLRNSAALIRMQLSFSRERMQGEIMRTIRASGAHDSRQDVYVRYAVTRGEGPIDLYPDPALRERFVITVKAVPNWKASFRDPGVVVAVASTRRNPSNALDPRIKGGNYLNSVLAVLDAREKGADDGLLLNQSGFVTEASNSNVFFVINGQLVTPCPSVGMLNGLTKQTIQKACASHGIEVIEREIAASELADASECFLSSATREVMPVSRLILEGDEAVTFPAGGGEMTRAAAQLYDDYVSDYVARNSSLSIFEPAFDSIRREVT